MSNLSGFLTSSDDKDSLTTGLPKRLRDGLWSKNPEDLNPWQIDVLTAADRIEQLEQTFDLRWSADMRAIEIWRKDNPGNELVMPDHTDLCVWCLNRIEELEFEVERLTKVTSSDADWLASYHKWCEMNGFAPSSSDLIAAIRELEKKDE